MNRLQADALLLLVAVIWGSAFVAQNLGMASIGPYTFTGVRFLLGTLIVLPFAWREWQRRPAHLPRLTAGDGAKIAALGLLLFGGAALQQIGIVSTTVTNAGFLTALYVPLVPVLMYFVHRDTPHWSVWPAGIGCVAGTWLLTGATDLNLNVGDLYVLASTLFWGFHVLLVGRIADRLHAPFAVACGQFLIVGIAGTLVGIGCEDFNFAGIGAAGSAILYAGILSVGIGYTGQVLGQRHTPAADAAIILSAETVFAALFGAWWLGERLSAQGLAGCALILVSILAVQLLPSFAATNRVAERKKA